VRRARLAVQAFLLATPLSAQPADPLDVTTYPVVLSAPGMSDVTVTQATWGDGLAMEVARPSRPAGAKLPAVVFVNGVGGRLNEWEIYRSWARLVAAHGLAGVTFEGDRSKPAETMRSRLEDWSATSWTFS
jgi:hypothetical protein